MAELSEGRCTVLLHFIGVFLPFRNKGAVVGVFGMDGRVKWSAEVVDINLDVSCIRLFSCLARVIGAEVTSENTSPPALRPLLVCIG